MIFSVINCSSFHGSILIHSTVFILLLNLSQQIQALQVHQKVTKNTSSECLFLRRLNNKVANVVC